MICTLDGLVAAIEYRKGETVWELKFDSPIFSTPARLSSKELVVAEVGGRVHCIQSGFRVSCFFFGLQFGAKFPLPLFFQGMCL